jgi:hypothetical protein
VKRPALSNRAHRLHCVVIARVQLRERGIERAAIGVSVLRTIATVLGLTLGRELLIACVLGLAHGSSSYFGGPSRQWYSGPQSTELRGSL